MKHDFSISRDITLSLDIHVFIDLYLRKEWTLQDEANTTT